MLMLKELFGIIPDMFGLIINFHNQTIFQKCECTFLDQVARDSKSVLTFENCPLVAEVKLKT